MAEEHSKSPFSSFWKRSVDNPRSKEFVFLPPNETKIKSDNSDLHSDASDSTKNQLRRAQVRKAQSEHRNRKKNYVTHLEQDAIDLRKAIATGEREAGALRTENDRMRITLWGNDQSSSNVLVEGSRPPDRRLGIYGWPLPLPDPPPEVTTSYQDMSPVLGMSVTIDYNDTVNASCLQAYHSSANEPEVLLNTPTMFNFPANSFTHGCGIANRNPDLLKPSPSHLPQPRLPLDLEAAEIAINFILALEHPCRTHFHPIPTDFNPAGAPTGHELMASTSLYAHAPPYVFSHFSEVAWDTPLSPVAELQKLKEMNESLPKRDFEITPVQAWFMLVGRYDLDSLLGNEDVDRRERARRKGGFLERLKRELSTLVDCFGFGAAMDRTIFWEAVERVASG